MTPKQWRLKFNMAQGSNGSTSLLSGRWIHAYSLPIDNPRHRFSSWRHLGTLSASMWEQLKLYIWRLHPQLPNGFKRHPEYSSLLFLWAPGQLESDVKDRCKLRYGTGWIPIYLCFKAPRLHSPSSNIEVPVIFVNTRHCFSSTEAELFVYPQRLWYVCTETAHFKQMCTYCTLTGTPFLKTLALTFSKLMLNTC